jgi:hypothetical protein
VALFYGIYPSMFGHNASSDRYWDDPALYERDRPLFQRYIPMIRLLNTGGWRPVTHARSGDSRVLLERFGQWPDLRFTARNVDDGAAASTTVVFDADALGLPGGPLQVALMLSGDRLVLGSGGSSRSVTLDLGPGATEVLHLTGYAAYVPCAIGGGAR